MIAGRTYVRGGEFRLNVFAPSVRETIQLAGGWIFDQARMGWTVSVAIPHECDDRPLRILGAALFDLDAALQTVHDGPGPCALAVAATLYEQEAKVRDLVSELLTRRNPQVTLWGEPCQAELRKRFAMTEHHLSSAARIFKAHALAAASTNRRVTATEPFRGTRLSVVPLLQSTSKNCRPPALQ